MSNTKQEDQKGAQPQNGINISNIADKLSDKKVLFSIIYLISMIVIIAIGFYLRSGAMNAQYFDTPDSLYFFMRGEAYAQCGKSVCTPDGLDPLRQFNDTSKPLADMKLHFMPITLVAIHKIIEPFTGMSLKQVFINHAPYLTVLLLLVIFFIGRELFNTTAGIIAAGLAAVATPSLFRSSASFGDHDLFGTFFIMLSLFYFIKYFKENQNQIKATFFITLSGIFALLTPLYWSGSQPYITLPVTAYFAIKALLQKINTKDLLNITIFTLLSITGIILKSIPSTNTYSIIEILKDVSRNIYIDLLLGVVVFYLVLVLVERLRLDKKYNINSKVLAIGISLVVGCGGLFVLGGFNFSLFQAIFDKIISPVRGVGGSGAAVVGQTVAENQAVSFSSLWEKFNLGSRLPSFFMPFALAVYGFLILLTIPLYRALKTKLFNLTHQEIFLIVWFAFSVYAALGGMRMFFVFSWVVGIYTAMFFYLAHKQGTKLIDKSQFHDKKIMRWLLIVALAVLLLFNFYINTNIANASKVTIAYTYMGKAYDDTAYSWIRNNTNKTDVIGHWWDYGYWTEYLGQRPVHVDGGGSGNRYEVAHDFMTTPNEEEAYNYCLRHHIKYVMIFPSDLGKFIQIDRIGQRPGGFGVLGNPRTQVSGNVVYNIYQGIITKPTPGFFEDLYAILAIGKSTQPNNKSQIGNITEVKLNTGIIQNRQIVSQTGYRKLKYICTPNKLINLTGGVINGCYYYINESVHLYTYKNGILTEYRPVVYSSPPNMVGLRLILFNGKGMKHFKLVHMGDPINDGGSIGQIKIFKVI